MKRETFLSNAEINALFGNIQEIVTFQRQFLQNLDEAIELEPNFHQFEVSGQYKVILILFREFHLWLYLFNGLRIAILEKGVKNTTCYWLQFFFRMFCSPSQAPSYTMWTTSNYTALSVQVTVKLKKYFTRVSNININIHTMVKLSKVQSRMYLSNIITYSGAPCYKHAMSTLWARYKHAISTGQQILTMFCLLLSFWTRWRQPSSARVPGSTESSPAALQYPGILPNQTHSENPQVSTAPPTAEKPDGPKLRRACSPDW